MKIWHRYLFKQISSVFLFILFAIFTVYLFIDLSVHSMKFLQGGYKIQEIAFYYLHSFSSLIDVFIPFAFLLACLKVLSDLTSHLEILSLQMARLSLKKILTPFFVLALGLTLISYANHEWIAPQSVIYLKNFRESHLSKQEELRSKKVLRTQLEDQSTLVYHFIDSSEKKVKDLFWIRSSNDIWHMKSLSFGVSPPEATCVDHFTMLDGKLIKDQSYDKKTFAEMRIQGPIVPTTSTETESKALSTLFKESKIASPTQHKVQTYLHHKLAMPLLPILILLVIAPLTFIHTRDRRIFATVALSILAFIVVMILVDTLLVLSTNKILRPWLAMWIVPFTIMALSIRRFAKI